MLGFALLFVLGLSAVTTSPAVGPKVVGGENANQGEFPFIVSLQSWGSHFCGGSLISDQWVLTAGHCLYEGVEISIYYGNAKLSGTEQVYTVNVDKAIRHPNYTNEQNLFTATMRNDLALIKLEHPVTLSANVQPIKLPKQNETVPINKTATLAGWGLIDDKSTTTDVLKKVDLTIFDYPTCDRYNKQMNFDDDQNICAGDDKNTKGQCSGDSGGPLVFNGVLWGVVSWSIKPCISAPGVFTTTSVYIDWINSVIASN